MPSVNAFEMPAINGPELLPISLLNATSPLGAREGSAVGETRSVLLPNRDRMVIEHMQTVQFIARQIHRRLPQHVELEELVSAGLVGLIDAAAKFDRSKDVQFTSYAQFRIRGAILDSLRTLDWSPRDLRRKGRAFEEANCTLFARLGRTPTECEIAAELGITVDIYQQVLGDLKNLEIGSLNDTRSQDSDEEELGSVQGPVTEDPLFRYLEGETRERLIAVIDTLPEKERLVLTLYYYEELTMKEIGLTLGVVESRISQIHAAAVRRLRRSLGASQQSRSPTHLSQGICNGQQAIRKVKKS